MVRRARTFLPRGRLATSATPALPQPSSTPSAWAALSEARMEESVEAGMATLRELSRFWSDPAPKAALPEEGVTPLPPTSGSAVEVGADAGAQGAAAEVGVPEDPSAQAGAAAEGGSQTEEAAPREARAAEEAALEAPSTRVGAAAGGGSQAEEAASREAETAEVEVVSVSSGEPSDVAEVAEPSRAEGPAALVRVGRDPYQCGGPRLTWSDRNQPGTPPVFVLDDAEEQGYWDRLQSGCEGFNKTLSLALSILHEDIRPAGQALFERSRGKSEFLCRERDVWRHLLLEEQRTAAAEAWLAEAQQRMANLSVEMADWRTSAFIMRRRPPTLKRRGRCCWLSLSAPVRMRRRPRG
ncbi:uncharacterized protein [Miscanthus floridulus]|uniref:uncharacterized protein n=1 Tax=Miscanthus floridulus TaxID=154761 RepID=UPI00345A0501